MLSRTRLAITLMGIPGTHTSFRRQEFMEFMEFVGFIEFIGFIEFVGLKSQSAVDSRKQ